MRASEERDRDFEFKQQQFEHKKVMVEELLRGKEQELALL